MYLAGSVDWGTVPAWVSGILSGVSVLLVVFVILRDRAKGEHAQVDKLAVVVQQKSQKRDGYKHHLTIINGSDAVFYDVRLAIRLDERKERERKMPIPLSTRVYRHWRYRRVLHHALVKGGGDDWHFEEADGERTIMVMLKPGEEVVAKVRTSQYRHPVYVFAYCKDASGRHWAIDVQSRQRFRADRLYGGMENWG